MAFNPRPTNNVAPLPETKHKEKKSRYSMATLQVRWPMRAARSTDGSPISKKSKDGTMKHRKGKSVDLHCNKSTDSFLKLATTSSELKNDRRLEANALPLSHRSPLNSTLAWIKRRDSPQCSDARALESVQLPEKIAPRIPTPERHTKALNSIFTEPKSSYMPPTGDSYPIAARQRQTLDPNLARVCDISPPPMHPGRNRPSYKASSIGTLQSISVGGTTEKVSPIVGSVFQRKAIPASPGDGGSIEPMTIVSPLSIYMPQPQRTFVPPPFDKIIQVETDPLLDQSGKSGGSATSSEFGRSVSAPNSPSSSRSSIYSDDFPQKPLAPFTEGCSRSSKAYSLISPVTAGVFDDDDADLKRIPTFKHKSNPNQQRNKPLPPEPVMKIPPLSIRRTSGLEPMGTVSHCGRLIQPTSKPLFLPRDPRPSDLDILDEAFRRSGLHHVSPNKCAKSKSGQASGSGTLSSSPSLHKVTLELEEQLSVLSKPTQNRAGWLKIGHNRCSSSEFPAGTPPKPLKPRSSWRRSGSYSAVSPIKGSSSKKSWKGKGKVKLSPTISESVEDDNKRQSSQAQVEVALQVCANGGNTKNSTVPSNNGSDDLKPTEKINRMAMFTKPRAESVERNLRMRLPRLRTQLSAKSIRGPVNLSAVVESPTNQANHPNLNDHSSPKQRIMAALDRLDPQQPEHPRKDYSYNNNDNDNPARVPPLVFGLDDCQSASTSEHAGSKDMLCDQIPSEVAKSVIYEIMQKIDNLEDLFNLAVINKAFYSVFHAHSLTLIKDTLFRMSPAAWELREICPPWEAEGDEAGDIDMPVPEYTPNLYIHHYTRDLYTMVALKSLILVRCESFLRPDTARALAGLDETRCAEVDEAFWRVWTFCKLFGCGKGREDDVTAQVDWLNGGRLAEAENRGTSIVMQYPAGVHSVLFNAPPAFSKGNHGGLSATELYDMMEIWTCLGVLLQVFHGKCKEARDFGVFDGLNVASGDVAKEESLTESWTQYLLTLGPSAILALTSINPEAPIETLFSRAKANGWTKWKTPDLSHGGAPRLFLKEAVSQVYESRLSTTHTPASSRTPKSNSPPPHSPSPVARHRGHSRNISESSSCSLSSPPGDPSRRRQAGFAAELRRKRKESQGSDMSVSLEMPTPLVTNFTEERPISHFSAVIENLDPGNSKGQQHAGTPVPPSPATVPHPIDTTVGKMQSISSSIQNTPISDSSIKRKPLPDPVPSSAPPPLPTVTLESPTPPPGAALTLAPSSRPLLHAASVPKQHQRTFSTPETTAEEKISRGRYSAPASKVLDPVDIAMHKMVKELGFDEHAAKWALKCTDTGESLDVAAAINLLLQGGGHVDPLALSSSEASATGNVSSSSGTAGGGSGDENESVGVNGMCRRKTMEASRETEDDVWRPVWRWA
ncbi:hypothetical protein EMPG_10982 [Blastomyces silverae]|uniref:Uncharacterized protein n=1 Tax=Blastomyces silverae TaxID=2060906 RepID=A0A0H1B3F1_9EURO|nr:hypothetical protein EMPG_10982 [Blastomyces silverae]